MINSATGKKKSDRDVGLINSGYNSTVTEKASNFTRHIKADNVEPVTKHNAMQVQRNMNLSVQCSVNPMFHKKDLKSWLNVALEPVSDIFIDS